MSALSCHTASCRAQQCWKQNQKYKTKTKAARPRPKDRISRRRTTFEREVLGSLLHHSQRFPAQLMYQILYFLTLCHYYSWAM